MITHYNFDWEEPSYVNIRPYIERFVEDEGIVNATIVVSTLDKDSSILISSNQDVAALTDLNNALRSIVPSKTEYSTNMNPEEISAILRAAVIGKQRIFLVRDGVLVLGEKQVPYVYCFNRKAESPMIQLTIL